MPCDKMEGEEHLSFVIFLPKLYYPCLIIRTVQASQPTKQPSWDLQKCHGHKNQGKIEKLFQTDRLERHYK